MLPSEEVLSWLQGFADLGWRFLELYFKVDKETGKVAKLPRRSMDHFKDMAGEKGLSFALACLEKGSPIGVYPPRGFWVFDADDADQVAYVANLLFDRGMTPLMDSTRRGGHFVFRQPDDFPTDGLKQALHLPKRDFIFGPNTYIVAPGSKGKGLDYLPAIAWFDPPVLDPRMIEPDGKFWDEVDTRPYLVSAESLTRRTFAARGYLQNKAPVCVRGTGQGCKTLSRVAAHVVSWWGMSPNKATAMMFGPGSWNSRFVDGKGKSTPFNRSEILAACQAAEGKGSPYGRIAWVENQTSQEETHRMESHIGILKSCLTEPKSLRVPVAEVLDVFSWLGCPDLTSTKFGSALTAHGIERVQATQRKHWSIERLNLRTMTSAMIEAERRRRGARSSCPLCEQWGESLREHQPVTPISVMHARDQVEQVVTSHFPSERLSIATLSPEIITGYGYQTGFDWAENSSALTLAPESAYLPKLAELRDAGLLIAMSSMCPAAIRDEVIARFWPLQKAAKVSLRMMRHACRKSGLVTDDGTLTPAGLMALGVAHQEQNQVEQVVRMGERLESGAITILSTKTSENTEILIMPA